MKNIRSTKVRGRKWKIQWREPSSYVEGDDALGWCYPEERVIAITKGLTNSLTAEIILHEVAHAFFPDLTEEAITQYAKEAADTLARVNLIDSEKEERELT